MKNSYSLNFFTMDTSYIVVPDVQPDSFVIPSIPGIDSGCDDQFDVVDPVPDRPTVQHRKYKKKSPEKDKRYQSKSMQLKQHSKPTPKNPVTVMNLGMARPMASQPMNIDRVVTPQICQIGGSSRWPSTEDDDEDGVLTFTASKSVDIKHSRGKRRSSSQQGSEMEPLAHDDRVTSLHDSDLKFTYTLVDSPRSHEIQKEHQNHDCCDHCRQLRQKSPYHSKSNALFKSSNALSQSPIRPQFKPTRREITSISYEDDRIGDWKSKVMSAWNNVKYGWHINSKSNFKSDSPVFLLGQYYHRESKAGVDSTSMQKFMSDFRSRIWMTYRRGFTSLPGSRLSTDCGWGCMLRSAQMLLAETLIRHFVGRDWRLSQCKARTREDTFHRYILKWLGDTASTLCPFSLHALVAAGRRLGKEAGDWHGPATAALCVQSCLESAPIVNPKLRDLVAHVAQDCTVYTDDLIELCTTPCPGSDVAPGASTWRSLLLIIPARLGSSKFNSIYTQNLVNILAYDASVGIIGGKPRHSLYFCGSQDDKLIYLDPHYCQDYVDVTKVGFSTESWHCECPRKLQINKMDPSCAVGFYFKTRADLELFFTKATELTVAPMQQRQYPLFTLARGRRADNIRVEHLERDEKLLRVRSAPSHLSSRSRLDTRDSDDDYVLL